MATTRNCCENVCARKKAPAEAGALNSVTSRLEGNLRCKLHASGAAPTQERVADADVSSGGEPVIAAVLAAGRIGRTNVANEIGQQRAGKVGMVEQVKELSAELQGHVLGQRRVFEDGEIELLEARPFE